MKKNKALDGTVWGWLYAVGMMLLVFGSMMWAATGLLQMGQLLGLSVSGVSLIALSAIGCALLGAVVLGFRWAFRPR